MSPNGTAQIAGGTPWNFAVDILSIQYRTDPAAIAALLPPPLEPSREEPDVAYVWFGDWQGLWSGHDDMLAVNPERCLYTECLIGVRCSYQGVEGHRVVYIWVDKDFSLARGWFMGFPKKIGSVHMGTRNRHLHALNPAMQPCGVGSRYGATCESHGERLVTAGITVTEKIEPPQLPRPFGTDLFHTLHFPSADVNGNGKPLLHQLVRTVSSDISFGELWAGDGELTYHPSLFEEHDAIAPQEILGAYIIPVGFRIQGTTLLHTY
ncbi:MAG: acetoacetate decarboxylase family protein [Solirubrobacterales bacterium]|nr:acetoacetate decarboxylase family protein [Solirubrobacterales bacterium]